MSQNSQGSACVSERERGRSMQLSYSIRHCALGEGIYIFDLNVFKCTCNMVTACVPENTQTKKPDLPQFKAEQLTGR